jgi:hypothetical protein
MTNIPLDKSDSRFLESVRSDRSDSRLLESLQLESSLSRPQDVATALKLLRAAGRAASRERLNLEVTGMFDFPYRVKK